MLFSFSSDLGSDPVKLSDPVRMETFLCSQAHVAVGIHGDLSSWLLLRLQFVFTVVIGLGAWLTLLEVLRLATSRAA
jgi:hypothetical protein